MASRKRTRDEDGVDGYAWEGEMERPWENIEEDDRGHLKTHKALQDRRHADAEDERVVRRGVIRYIYVVLDFSEGSQEKDVHPSRHALMLETLYDFIHDFFDQNPLSQMGLILTRDSAAEKLAPFLSDPAALQNIVEELYLGQGSGSPSIENTLRRAMSAYEDVPGYATRELLLLYNSLHSCDPGHVNEAIQECVKHRIQCSVIGIGAELHILRQLAKDTHGTYGVCVNEQHYRDLLLGHVTPSPSPAFAGQEDRAELILMGFPQRLRSRKTLCFCHRKEKRQTTEGYVCPRCKAKYCSLPTVCSVCSLTLVSSPHLARSYHHLFPLSGFEETKGEGPFRCFGCGKDIAAKEDLALQCPECQRVFCLQCDAFIHKALHNCPGCV
jgi:transcription initiation factor TFIIH subunit 2